VTRPVVAGVDGSPASLVAADVAARMAAARSLPVHLVHGYLHPFGYGVAIDPYAGLPPPTEDAERMLEKAAATVRTAWPGLVVEARQVPGGPAVTLIEESRRAELIVVGGRGHGGFAGLLLGSVGAQVAGHAHCPVMVIRPPDRPPPDQGPVMVGVDGSPGCASALAFAADEAARRGSTLTVVHAWCVDAFHHKAETYAGVELACRNAAAALVADAAATARRQSPGLAIEERLVQTLNPEHALVEASRDAGLVVVGSRGLGGFVGLVLGSVGQALLHHAMCPVVIAHPLGHRV
jgi:nucleotide-binding universal stress UspA family protein